MDKRLDKEGQKDLDEAVDDFLAAAKRIEQKAKERCAQSGEELGMVLLGIDRSTGRIAVLPVDPPSDRG